MTAPDFLGWQAGQTLHWLNPECGELEPHLVDDIIARRSGLVANGQLTVAEWLVDSKRLWLQRQHVECPCACGKIGQPRQKIWKGETSPHVKACRCKRCEGSRHYARARRRENRVAKDIDGERLPMSGRGKGCDIAHPRISIEETSREQLVRGIRRWWQSAQTQDKLRGLNEKHEGPRAYVLSWDGQPQLVAMDYDSFLALLDDEDQTNHDKHEETAA